MVTSQNVGRVWTWFWYQIKAESVLLTMLPKTHFTQNVTCFPFCGRASQMFCMCIHSLGYPGTTFPWEVRWAFQTPGDCSLCRSSSRIRKPTSCPYQTVSTAQEHLCSALECTTRFQVSRSFCYCTVWCQMIITDGVDIARHDLLNW